MTVEKYTNSVLRTWRTDLSKKDRILNAEAGLLGECGELADHLKKVVFHGHEYDREYAKKEFGDIFYYHFAYCNEVGKPPLYHHIEYIKHHISTSKKEVLRNIIYYNSDNDIDFLLVALYSLDFHLSDVLKTNIDKLQARYPDGFSEQASRGRVV